MKTVDGWNRERARERGRQRDTETARGNGEIAREAERETGKERKKERQQIWMKRKKQAVEQRQSPSSSPPFNLIQREIFARKIRVALVRLWYRFRPFYPN